MERLTCPAQGYCEMYCKEYGRCFGEPETCDFSKEVQLYEKLRDYESSYLEPLEVRRLERAKKEGRLVVLPCKVGDTVYDTRQDIDSRRKNVVVPLSVSGFDVTLCVWETWYGPFPKLKDFGKTVFLTREEAEAALKGGNNATD